MSDLLFENLKEKLLKSLKTMCKECSENLKINFRVEGLLGITFGVKEVFLLNIEESVKMGMSVPSIEFKTTKTDKVYNMTQNIETTRLKNTSILPHSPTLPQISLEPQQNLSIQQNTLQQSHLSLQHSPNTHLSHHNFPQTHLPLSLNPQNIHQYFFQNNYTSHLAPLYSSQTFLNITNNDILYLNEGDIDPFTQHNIKVLNNNTNHNNNNHNINF